MAIKQPLVINFGEGLDTKTDPKQVKAGKFLSLVNSIFTKFGLLNKRNGFRMLPSLPDATSTFLTTFNGNLTAIGNKLLAYAQGPMTWISKGNLQPISLSVMPAARSTFNQVQCDIAVASNGLMCVVYTEVDNGVSSYKYAIKDQTTGQYIISPTAIPVGSGAVSGSPRVFILGGYFVIVFTTLISATSHLQFIAVSIASPSTVIAAADIASAYDPDPSVAWDGVVVLNKLFIAYNTSAGSQRVNVTFIDIGFNVTTPTSFIGEIATTMSMCADMTDPVLPIIYAVYLDATDGSALAVDYTLQKRMSPTEFVLTGTFLNVACSATAGYVDIIYEELEGYSYDATLSNNHLDKVRITLPATVTTGTIGTTTNSFLQSVGLASKAFVMNGTIYFLTAYQSSNQSTYFLCDYNGNILSRFAYQNGGGYCTLGLPQAQVIGSTVHIGYLYKDLIQSVNKSQGVANSGGIYSQTGINLSSQTFSTLTSTAEIGLNLNLSGGFMMSYDGDTLSEQGFHLYPDNVEVTLVADPGPTGTATNGTAALTVSSAAGLVVGMAISDVTNPSYVPANTFILAIVGSVVTMSKNATHAISGDTMLFVGAMSAQQYFYQALYEWTDAQGNIFRSAPSIPATVIATSGHTSATVHVPTLRLTAKSGIKIVIYRWSAAQENYYQITSITNPVINDESVPFISYRDIQSDAQILGNSLIYTTGGVLENTGGPACSAITLFDDRLWCINAEDRNLLSNSKQVIESTPVEMSDLLTTFVAPSTGVQGSSGLMECIFPMDDKLIIFKKDALYYINGTGPDNTGSNSQYSQPIFITSNVGCSNQNSIVMTPSGLMFQSDKGIWLLDRSLGSAYIGAPVEEFNDALVVSALSIPETNQVRFTLDSGVTLMYDTFFQQWGEFEGIPGVFSTIYQGLHSFINKYGQVFQETPGVYLDGTNPVLLSFITSWLNLAGIHGYQRIYEFMLLGTYLSPHTLNLSIAYDFGNPIQPFIINPTNATGVYGSDSLYGQTSPYGGPGNLEQWRVQTQIQKCQTFQISLQEQFDPSIGAVAGAGFNLSGISCVVGVKQGYRPFKGASTVG